jgi:pimeloyl-ACP methyl ester carboxylesterase
MVSMGLAIVLLALVLITPLGVVVIEAIYRPSGRFVDAAGARLHVVDLGPRDDASGPPVVLIHGASANLESMRHPLGELLAARHRVILIDRPGHGFSTRDRLTDATPAIQAAMIDEALGKMGVARAIVVAHSWAGALGAAMALDHPERLAGLVLLAPVTHPWNGGVSWYNDLAVRPVAGWLFTRLVALPAGLFALKPGARSVFAPQPMPEDYVNVTAVPLLVRPAEFTANAHDLVALKPSVTAQAPRYGQIKTPVVVISGNVDRTVSIDIHSRRFVAAVPHARLVELDGLGHMPQNVAPGVVVDAVEELMARPAASLSLAAE